MKTSSTAPEPVEPAFVLSGPDGTLLADARDATTVRFSEVTAAQTALGSGDIPILLGALPFDSSNTAALMAAHVVHRVDALPDWPDEPLPPARIAAAMPSPADHRARICRVLDELATPGATLRKVVLARTLQLVADAPLDARTVLRRLVAADPSGYGYLVDLTAAGGRHCGATLVGASPELLVARAGDLVTCRPFAGSAERSTDPAVDAANGAALVASAKDRHEHQLVVDRLGAVLEPLCAELDIASAPQLNRTAAVWHLSTEITGRLCETSTTALDLALALHPTPAVGGDPTGAAVEVIRALEGDRGFYAGTVGWCDASGDGRWMVSIRCAELSHDRCHALAHAGSGIVAGSDPDSELAETTTKFTTILSALGIAQPSAPPAG